MPTFREDLHLGHKVPLIETDDMRDGLVTTDKLSDGAVTEGKLAEGAVTNEKLGEGAVIAGNIAEGAVENKNLAEGAVIAGNIAENAVTEGKLADGAVTQGKIAEGAVIAGNIAEGAVENKNLAEGAVIAGNIAEGAVMEGNLAPGAVTSDKLAPGVITQLESITDAEPTAGSKKPVQSGGVQKTISEQLKNVEGTEIKNYITRTGYIDENGKFHSSSSTTHGLIPTKAGDLYIIENYSSDVDNIRYGFVTKATFTNNEPLPCVDGTSVNIVKHNSKAVLITPEGCNYIAFNCAPYYNAKIYKIRTGYELDNIIGSYFSPTENISVSPQNNGKFRITWENGIYYWTENIDTSAAYLYLIPVKPGEVYRVTFTDNKNLREYSSGRILLLKNMPDIQNLNEGDDADVSDICPMVCIEGLTGLVFIPEDVHCLYGIHHLGNHIQFMTIEKCSIRSDSNSIAGSTAPVESNGVLNDTANIAILTNKKIPFGYGSFAGLSRGNIYYTDNNKRLHVDLPTENLKSIKIINNDYIIGYAILYQDIIPTSNYEVISSSGVKNIDVYNTIQGVTVDFNPNRIFVTLAKTDDSDLSDITSIDDIIELEGITKIGSYQQKLSVKKITMQMGYLSATTGLYPTSIEYYDGYSHSARLIKNKGSITIKTVGIIGKLYCYGSGQVYLGQKSRINFDTTGGETVISLPSSVEYYRVAVDGNIESIDIESYWDGNDEEYQKRPSNGYQPLTFRVKTVACGADSDVSEIKEQYWLSTDSGMLHLPENYTENGEPTPLIIFVHGAAGNFKPNSTGFTSGNPYAPEWDAMGYAQLDVDLIPDKYNSYANNQYGGSSDDVECIIGAYKWVIEHFNIRTDGIYLMGRSRGGQAVLQTLGKYNPSVLPVICAISNAGAHSLINYGLTNSSSSAEWDLICASYGLPSDGRPTPSGNSVLTAQNELYSFLLENISVWWKKACVAALLMSENGSEYKTSSAILEFIHNHPRVSGKDNVDYLNFLKTLKFKSPVPLRFDWCVADTTQPWKDNSGLGNYSSVVKDGFVNNLSGNSEYREWPTVDTTKEIISGATDRGHWHELYNIYDGDYTLPNGVVVTNPSMARIEWLMWCRRHDSRFSN